MQLIRLPLASRLTLAAMGLLIAAATLPVLSGCRNRVQDPYRTQVDPALPRQVYVADNRLARRLAFTQPSVSRDEAGILYVNVPVRNADARPMIINYRFAFLDENGNVLSEGSYQTATLEANTLERLRGNSTSPRADDWQLDIRPAR